MNEERSFPPAAALCALPEGHRFLEQQGQLFCSGGTGGEIGYAMLRECAINKCRDVIGGVSDGGKTIGEAELSHELYQCVAKCLAGVSRGDARDISTQHARCLEVAVRACQTRELEDGSC